MKTDVFSSAKWITTEDFAFLDPIDIFSMQMEKREIPRNEKLQNYHVTMMKRFSLKNIANATINITADDYYKLYINGEFVGQGPSQGYSFSYYWNSFNVSDYLKIGDNEISVSVYYHGLLNRAYNSADNRMGLLLEMINDNQCVLKTDKSWVYSLENRRQSRGVLGAATLFTEDIDNRIKAGEIKNCKEIETDHILSPHPVTSLQIYKKIPVKTSKLNDNYYVYDFGREICGSVVVSVVGKSGDTVRVLMGEEIDSKGCVRYNMRCSCNCENIWTLSDGNNLYDQYDYIGFRYLAIETNAQINDVYANVRHFPFDDDYCVLKTDHEDLQKVWQLCKDTVKYATQETFIDCPQREKGQYAGDLTVTSAAHLILTGKPELLRKAIENQMQSAKISPSLLAVTPGSLVQEIADYSFQFPILALRYYDFSKDKAFLLENLKVCEAIIDSYQSYAGENGLLRNVTDKWNLVDWPDNLRDGYDFSLDPLGKEPHNVLNAFYIGCVLQTEQIRDILGIVKPKQSGQLIASFNEEFYDFERRVYTDCKATDHAALHSNIIPAFYGFNPEESNETIKTLITEKGMCCGVYMSYFMLKALCRLGGYEDALHFILSDEENSWLNMIREGATTCFEAWGKDKKWNTSLCHPWAVAPVSVLAEDILPNMPETGIIIYKNNL